MKRENHSKSFGFLLHHTFLIESDAVDIFLFGKFAGKKLRKRYFDLYSVFLFQKKYYHYFYKNNVNAQFACKINGKVNVKK